MLGSKGMINRGSSVGDYIFETVKRKDIKTIVEIGTWNGLGTTKCIYDGIIASGKKDYYVLSLECNLSFYNEARGNLVPLLNNFEIVHGTITTLEEILPQMDQEKHARNNLRWLDEEFVHLKNAPNVIDMIPDKIDLLILDGGEYSSSKDWEKLHERSHYIILDDTRPDMVEDHFGHILKNSEVRKYVLSQPEKFKIIEDNQSLGSCGWCICENLLFTP